MMSREDFFKFLKANGGLIVNYTNGCKVILEYGCSCGDGWLELIAELISKLIDAGWTREVLQIKEKFGGLRFYAEGLKGNMTDMIIEYEQRSFHICEICGSEQSVSLRGRRWVKTLCDECAGQWLEKQKRVLL